MGIIDKLFKKFEKREDVLDSNFNKKKWKNYSTK